MAVLVVLISFYASFELGRVSQKSVDPADNPVDARTAPVASPSHAVSPRTSHDGNIDPRKAGKEAEGVPPPASTADVPAPLGAPPR